MQNRGVGDRFPSFDEWLDAALEAIKSGSIPRPLRDISCEERCQARLDACLEDAEAAAAESQQEPVGGAFGPVDRVEQTPFPTKRYCVLQYTACTARCAAASR